MKLINNVFLKSKIAICLSAVLALSACDSDDQDQGSQSTSSVSLTGVVIDGYLARATVFIDEDNNGTREAWEPFAFTDNDGYYSYNEKTEVDYCAATASEEEQQYCLSTNKSYANAVIRIDGGYDIITGQKFIGQLSRRVENIEEGTIDEVVVTPLTSLFTNVDDDTDKAALLAALDIVETDLDIDYFDDPNSTSGVNSSLLNKAVKVHKIVSVISDRLTDTYDEIGNDFGTPNDATGAVYESLAEQIIDDNVDDNKDIEDTLSDTSALSFVLSNAENTLKSIYNDKDSDLPSTSASKFSEVITSAAEINNVVNNLIDGDDTGFDLEDAKGTSRAVETLMLKTVDDEPTSDFVSFLNTDSADLDQLIENLSMDNADVGALVDDDFSDVTAALESSLIDDNVIPFSDLANKSLKISGDISQDSNNLEDSEFEFFLDGDAEATSGPLYICAKYIDEATRDASGEVTLGDGNTEGKLIEGYWSLISPNDAGESYNLVVTIDFLGSTYSAQLKASGVLEDGSNEYEFDFDGEAGTFDSEDTFTDFDGTVPTTDTACEVRLPSRIGI